MQCVSDLTKLRDCVLGRVRTLRQVINPISFPLTPTDRHALAFSTIELDNLVIVALRQYTKSCLLRSRTAAGFRVVSAVKPTTVEEAAAYVFSSLNPAKFKKMKNPTAISEKDEIVFRDPKRAEKVLMDYSASNLSNYRLALSLNAEVFSELKICRHFFSHRMRNTFDEVRVLAANLGVFGISETEQFLLRGRPGTGVRFLDGWLADVENFFVLAA